MGRRPHVLLQRIVSQEEFGKIVRYLRPCSRGSGCEFHREFPHPNHRVLIVATGSELRHRVRLDRDIRASWTDRILIWHPSTCSPMPCGDYLLEQRFRVAWDIVKLRRMLTPRLGVSAGIRYDLSFFHLGHDDSVELETVGTGEGIDLWLFGDLYLRLRFKELILRRGIWRWEHGNDTDIRTHGGHSVKPQLVHAQ